MASGQPLTITSASSLQVRQERQAWQNLAWHYFRTLGIAWYLSVFKSNAISRLRLFPAVLSDADEDPIPLEEPDSIQAVTLRDMASGFTGTNIRHQAMLAAACLHWEVPGEFYWHSVFDEASGRNTHELLSISELETWGSGGFQIRRIPNQAATPVGPKEFLTRVWQPDVQYQQLATSPMVANRDTLQEMSLLTQAGVAAAMSRVATAGMMTFPDEIDFQGSPKPDGTLSEFEEEFLRLSTAAIKDPRSPGRWMPLVIRGKGEYMTPEYLRWFSGVAAQPESVQKRLTELREIFVQDFNLPTGITNVSDMTHWNAWIVDAMNWPHLQPIAEGMLASLSRYVYQPFLVASGKMDEEEAAQNVIWYDESRVVSQPDRSAAATSGVSLAFIGGEAWRRTNGFNEDDKPTPAEQAVMFGNKWGDPGLAGTGDWRQATGKMATRVTETAAPGASVGPEAGPVADAEPANPAPPNPAPNPSPADPSPIPGARQSSPPAPTGKPAAPATTPAQPQSIAASAAASDRHRARLAALGPKLSGIDRDLLTRISVLADSKIHTTVRSVGSKLRSAAQGRPLVMEQIRGMDTLAVAARLGPIRSRTMGVDDRGMIHSAAAEFAAKARPWIASGQLAAVKRISTATGQDSDALEASSAEDRSKWLDVAEGVLLAGFVKAASDFLFSPAHDGNAPTKGEISDLVAPRSAIRQALSVAGGGGETQSGPPQGIGGGPMAKSMLADGGATVSAWTWNYTDSARSSFPGHLALDSIQFVSWSDPQLAVQPEDDWLDVDFYAPGDHDGCSCLADQSIVPVSDLVSGDDSEGDGDE